MATELHGKKETGRRESRFTVWLDRRTGLRHLAHEALDEPIPGGPRLAYVFGSGLLFILISQVITGVFLALYYVPSADHAHTTVAYIAKQVTGGSFLRSLHAYGSSAMIVTLVVHLAQTYFWGAYKGRREILWLSGLMLFLLVMGMAFTGYLLPWDQKAFFATAVGTNIVGEVPIIGGWLKLLMRGGAEMGTLTLSRFFVAHVFLIPGCVLAFVGSHVFLFRKAGAVGALSEDPVSPLQRRVAYYPRQVERRDRFYPRQVLLDIGFTVILLGILGTLAYFVPVELGPKANPADTQFIPRPEWYYLPFFQWLKYWNGQTAIIGIVIIPVIIAGLLVGLPFIDRSRERRPWKRPIAVSIFLIVFGSLIFLGWQSTRDDASDPAVVKQLMRQDAEIEAFRKKPFEPDMASTTLTEQNVALANPLAAAGKKIFAANSCDGCHGEGGIGTDAGPKLIGVGKKFDGAALANLLTHPTQKMKDGNMDAVVLPDDEFKSLIQYLQGLN